MKRYFEYILLAILGLVLTGCGSADCTIHSLNDLEGGYIAVLNHSISHEDFEDQFPESEMLNFKSASEFLLSMSIGKCDAGIVQKVVGETLLDRNKDYQTLPFSELQNDSTLVIAHSSLLPNQDNNLKESGLFERIRRNILSEGYWKLILKGFSTTVSMFLMGIFFAFLLAFLMTVMNGHKYLRIISKPISYFIEKIHDVPSIVLIFFFYYVVFATVHISGILVCSIALGVYTSGSLMKIFKVNLNLIDKNQHEAAQMLGLTGWKKYKYVILPQAVKPMLPFIGAESKVLLRATTYAGYISELDLVKVTEIIRNQTYDVLIPLLLVSAVFLILSRIIVESLSAIYNKAFKYD